MSSLQCAASKADIMLRLANIPMLMFSVKSVLCEQYRFSLNDNSVALDIDTHPSNLLAYQMTAELEIRKRKIRVASLRNL